MALDIRRGQLWRKEIENKPGMFADALEPFSKQSLNLQIVMGYAKSTDQTKGAVEIYPVTDANYVQCAEAAGLKRMAEATCLIVEGEDKPGIAYAIAKVIADAGINMHFAMCQSVDKQFQACFGFASEADADQAEKAIISIS
ncbi:MAG TPA: hypothetical protein V6C97_05290 [Oculatellaceae cyanobacterium]